MNKKQAKTIAEQIGMLFKKIGKIEDLIDAHKDDAERCARWKNQIRELEARYDGMKAVLRMTGYEVRYHNEGHDESFREWWTVERYGA